MEAQRTSDPRILILTVSHGASHQRASQALRKALLELNPGLIVQVEDALEHCTRWFRAYYDSYEIPLRYWPALWGWIESVQHRSKSTGPGWLYRQGAQPLFRLIQSFEPHVVVATEVGVCELAAMMKREARSEFRLVGAPTGVDVDRAWAQPEVDLYIVAAGEAAAQLGNAGVPHRRIVPCGMPVDPAFASLPADRAMLRTRLGLELDVPLLLVLFGGTGLGTPRRILPEIQRVQQPLQVMFITGQNARLKKEVARFVDHPRYRASGWVDNMQEWMSAADLLVTKPGASTVIEAIVCGLPLVAFDPLPGGERRTCNWIEKWRIGCWVRRPEDLGATIDRLLANREELQELRKRTSVLAQPRAAYDAAEAILRL